MIRSMSSTVSMSTVCRHPDLAIFRKWMICGTTFESDASWILRVISFRPGMNLSSLMRSSGPALLPWIAIASTTISPTSPFA